MRSQSVLIFHYHTFKNAGTSVDEMLKANFGDKWDHAEFRNPAKKHSNVDDVTEYLKQRPHLLAFSSHTALLPLPKLDLEIFPIFFIRHPIDRIRSAYAFERKQVADTYGAKLAKEQDFVGYLRLQLADPRHRQVRNFQTCRLAYNEPPENGSELARALRTLEKLPFVGLVEEYDRSVQRLEESLVDLCPSFRAFAVHKNRTQEVVEPMELKLEAIAKAIGAELYSEVLAANLDDIAIYERARAQHAAG